jgi:hypothetical protein
VLIRRDCIVNGTSLEHERWKRAHTDGLPEDGDQVSPAAKTAHTTREGGMLSAGPQLHECRIEVDGPRQVEVVGRENAFDSAGRGVAKIGGQGR